MTTATIDVARLDEIQSAAPDASVWAENLAALRDVAPDIADWIDRAVPADSWRPCLGLDGWPTWRIEAPGEAPRWLGATAAPLTRARALLAEAALGDRNPGLLDIGAGAELVELLRCLPRHCCVFVFVANPSAVAAVLRLHLIAAALRTARVAFIPFSTCEQTLSALLARYEGLLPPARLLCAPSDASDAIESAQRCCERAAQTAARTRATALAALSRGAADSAAAAKSVTRDSSPPLAAERACILSLTGAAGAAACADLLADAARELQWPALCSVVRGPRDVHLLPHCRLIFEHEPTLTIGVGHDPAALPVALGGVLAEWRIDAPADAGERDAGAASQLSERTRILAASPRIAELCRTRNETVTPFYWACDERDLNADVEAAGRETARMPPLIHLIGDFPDDDVAAAGVQHPTHKLLWNALRDVAAMAVRADTITRAAALLAEAQRRTGLVIREDDVRARFLRVIEERLVPAAVWRRILEALPREQVRLAGVGLGWGRVDIPDARIVPDMTPAAAIVAGYPDPLSAELLRTAARGVPLAMHWPGVGRAGLLGDVLFAREHFEPFADAAALQKFVSDATGANTPLRRRAQGVRQHLARHTYAVRLRELRRILRGLAD